MSPFILLAVLFAAFLHASWNAVVKVSGDRLVVMAVTTLSCAVLVSPLLFILPAPARESWVFLGMSAVLHGIYMLLLIKAYSHGDFVQIYPLARGSAPLLTAILGFIFLRETLEPLELAGMFCIVAGIFSLTLNRNSESQPLSSPALVYSLLTGLSIAIYSISDGTGARLSQNPHSYAVWMFFLDGFIIPSVAFFRRRTLLISIGKTVWKQGLLVAVLSAIGYWIIIWAFTQERIAMIAVLRETSVLFAALISALIIKEVFTRQRALIIAFMVVGIVLLGM